LTLLSTDFLPSFLHSFNKCLLSRKSNPIVPISRYSGPIGKQNIDQCTELDLAREDRSLSINIMHKLSNIFEGEKCGKKKNLKVV
jgi:hypothetical protein